jgi:hypothetical protein
VTQPARWYYLHGELRSGPLMLEHVRELVLNGTIGPDTYVWADGMPDWLLAREVPALTPPKELRVSLRGW